MRQTGRRRNIRSLIGVELFIKGACLSFLFPLLRGMITICLWAAGYSYVTKENVVSFLMSPCVILCFLLLLGLAGLITVFEANAVCLAKMGEIKGRNYTFPELFLESIRETGNVFLKKGQGRRFTAHCLLFVIGINIPLGLLMMYGFSAAGGVGQNVLWGIGALLLLFCLAGLFGLIFAEKRGLYHGLLKRGIFLFVIETVCYFLCLFLFITIVIRTTTTALSGVLLLRLFERYHLICGIVFASINTVVFEYFCAEILAKSKGTKKLPDSKEMTRKQNNCLWFFCALLLVFTGIQAVFYVRNQAVILAETLENVCITAHRGASEYAPENTMAALALAVEEGADYAEVDVRLTADGVPVLLHDEALFRTTRVLKNVDEVTYAELSVYDAGSSYSVEFAGEHIPRLSDVFEEFGGKIGFNIELKGKNDREVVEKTIELIKEYGLEESCVLSSASYRQLEWVKERDASLKTGYILSMVYGDFYSKEAADFFSIRSWYVTESVVKKAHTCGKEIHAWTVNKENELKRMKAIGVDNIITDKPAYAREIVQRNKLAETFGEWLLLLTSKN